MKSVSKIRNDRLIIRRQAPEISQKLLLVRPDLREEFGGRLLWRSNCLRRDVERARDLMNPMFVAGAAGFPLGDCGAGDADRERKLLLRKST